MRYLIIFLFLISCSDSKNEKLIKNCSDVLFFKSLLFIDEPLQNTIKYYRTTCLRSKSKGDLSGSPFLLPHLHPLLKTSEKANP
jgi:hypothetical protein